VTSAIWLACCARTSQIPAEFLPQSNLLRHRNVEDDVRRVPLLSG
jgi:hypothetical protein